MVLQIPKEYINIPWQRVAKARPEMKTVRHNPHSDKDGTSHA